MKFHEKYPDYFVEWERYGIPMKQIIRVAKKEYSDVDFIMDRLAKIEAENDKLKKKIEQLENEKDD